MTAQSLYAYADFFARLPSTFVFLCAMSFTIEWLVQRGRP